MTDVYLYSLDDICSLCNLPFIDCTCFLEHNKEKYHQNEEYYKKKGQQSDDDQQNDDNQQTTDNR